MLPLIPFALGIATGVAAVRLFKSSASKDKLDQLQNRLKEATVSSLESVSNASNRMKSRLEHEASPQVEEPEPMEKDLSEGVHVEPVEHSGQAPLVKE